MAKKKFVQKRYSIRHNLLDLIRMLRRSKLVRKTIIQIRRRIIDGGRAVTRPTGRRWAA